MCCRAREAVTVAEVQVHVCIFLFDILFVDGDVLLQQSFRERRKALQGVFSMLNPGYVELAHSFELNVSPVAPDDAMVSAESEQRAAAEQTVSACYEQSQAQLRRTTVCHTVIPRTGHEPQYT
jgi:hypothetical protein